MASFVLAVSGSSCSGKSTLCNWLARIFNGKIIHQDRFYRSDAEIPLLPNGVANWDCPDAIDSAQFVKALQEAKKAPADFDSALGSNRPKLDSKDVSLAVLERLTRMAEMAVAESGYHLIFIDGFLLFQDPHVYSEFNAGVFLKSSYATLLQRRSERERYVTSDGFWEDPPNYFEDVVWPEYTKNNKDVLDGTFSGLGGSLIVLDTDSCTIEANVSKAVAEICDLLRRAAPGGQRIIP